MSDSDDLVSAPVRCEKRRRQDSDSGSENDSTLFKGYKERTSEITEKLQQMSSDSEEDNKLKPVKKRQKFLHDKEDSKDTQFNLGSLKSEKNKPGKRLNNAVINKHIENNDNAGNKVEHNGYDDSDTDIGDYEKEETNTKPSGIKYVPEREKLSSDDSDDPVNSTYDAMKSKAPMKWETRESGNVSEDGNSIKSSASKRSMQIQGKKSIGVPKSPKNKSKPKEQLTYSSSDDEKSLNILKYALESDQDFKSSNQSESLKLQKEILTAVENRKGKNSDSDYDEEKLLKMASVKTAKHRDSSSDSSRDNSKEKQQNTKTEVKGGREKASNSRSKEEKPLNTTVKKTAEQSDILTDSGKEGNTKKQEMARIKKRARREVDSDSDEVENKLLKTVPKKTANRGDCLSGPGKEGHKERQKRTKTAVTSGSQRDSDSDSEDKMPLKTVLKKTAEEGGSSGDSDRDDSAGKQHKQKANVTARRRKDLDSEADSEEGKPLKTVSKKTTEDQDSTGDSGREDRNRNQQKQKAKVKARKRKVSDSESDSEEGKPLKTVLKKTTEEGGCSNDFGREGSRRKQQKQKAKVKGTRTKDSSLESDSEEEKPLKIVFKKITEEGGSSSDSGREDSKGKQQKQKAKVKARKKKVSDSESDSEEEKPLTIVSKKTTEEGGCSNHSGREGSRRKQQKQKGKVKGRRTKDSESDSEGGKPLKIVLKNTIRQQDCANDANRESSKQKQPNNSRKGEVSDSDGEKSTEDLIEEELKKLTWGSESNPAKDFNLNKSKPKRQEHETMHSSDSDDIEQLKASGEEKLQIKQSQMREQGKKTSRKESDSDIADEKSVKRSREETCNNYGTSDIIVSESGRKQKLQGIEKKDIEKIQHASSDSTAELDVSTESRKSQKIGRKENRGSDSDMDSDTLTKMNSAANVRTADAVKGMKCKHTAENSTDSSDVDEDNSKKRSSKTKNSYHSMSSSESEDSRARTKTKKTEAIKKASAIKRGNRSSDSNSDSSVSVDERSKKDKKKEGKKVAPENKRITSLKRYLRLAGIHTIQYSKVLQNCRSNKAKIEALLNLLRKEGLKGNPSILKCKRLRKKIETRREVQELDVGNIMEEKGRPQRSSRSCYTENYSEGYRHDAKEKAASIKQKFSRIRDIIDSDSD